ncbi:reverse transcriptase [Plakobranchus ocellatus]|uniref:Reverse transcriptase n=1 Tax=Plakobranchus ocellatus TaxID=259542 RepID=A0AAV3ZM48_9GAST|nr:reverse transcriptase [Plakobranchus ocellatus]
MDLATVGDSERHQMIHDGLDTFGGWYCCGLKITLILFVLPMEVILRAAEGVASQADLDGGCHMPPFKAFINDTRSCAQRKTRPAEGSDEFQAQEASRRVHKERQI